MTPESSQCMEALGQSNRCNHNVREMWEISRSSEPKLLWRLSGDWHYQGMKRSTTEALPSLRQSAQTLKGVKDQAFRLSLLLKVSGAVSKHFEQQIQAYIALHGNLPSQGA